jgi:KDO2-lipid IV(A) lauroyltransferase
MFYLLYALIWVIAWFPMNVLYGLSDLTYIILYHVVGYRKKVVRKNIRNSFPDLSESELKKIERKFYHFFCDLTFETIKKLHATEKEMMKRITFENVALMTRHKAEGRSVMMMTSHYGNWEWGALIGYHLPGDYMLHPVYQKLKNKHFDSLMFDLRSISGCINIEKDELVRKMYKMKKDGNLGIIGMVSDQSPARHFIKHSLTFLNQSTPVFTGTEQLAKKYNFPVYFMDIQRKKRGYYHINIIPVTTQPSETKEFEITARYMELLEEKIKTEPAYWLWSHNRWKYAGAN